MKNPNKLKVYAPDRVTLRGEVSVTADSAEAARVAKTEQAKLTRIKGEVAWRGLPIIGERK